MCRRAWGHTCSMHGSGSQGVRGVSGACVLPWPLFRTSALLAVLRPAVRLLPWLLSLSELPYGPRWNGPCQPWCLGRRVRPVP